jgi:hypothetical protein
MYNVLKIATEYQYCSTTVAVRAHCDNRNSPDVLKKSIRLCSDTQDTVQNMADGIVYLSNGKSRILDVLV